MQVENKESEFGELNTKSAMTKTRRVHGGNVREASRQYDIEERKIIDFSASVNPLGPSPAAVRAAKRSLSRIDRYPDSRAAELRRAIARYFGIAPGQVLCGGGSNALIHLLPRVFRPKQALVPVPAYAEYAAAVEDAGGSVKQLLLREQDGFRLDPVEMPFALAGAEMAFLCNPHNPSGRLIVRQEMLEIFNYAATTGTLLVVDEAFMDFDESESILKESVQTPGVVCLRAFTKFFGLSGLRIGYAVGHEETISRLEAGQEPWTVSIPAEAAGVAALADWGYIRRTREVIGRERERLASELRLLPGVEPFPSSANFLLVKLTVTDGTTVVRKLAERGLLVRDCSSFAGLDSRFIRIAVRTRRENKRLVKALRALLLP